MSEQPQGYGKVGASILASWVASYTMTQFSLHGVDFSILGVSSEVVKSTIVGTLAGFFTWLSPRHFIDSVTCAITFCREAVSEWHDALKNTNKGNPQ